MAMKMKDVAAVFQISDQTIRNWVTRAEFQEFFSIQARRADGRSQAEFLANDLEVLNSIKVMLKQKADWKVIAENLRSGWRDTNMPNRLMVMDEQIETATSLQLITELAITHERNENQTTIIEKYEDTISELRTEIKEHLKRIGTLTETIMQIESAKVTAQEREKAAVEINKKERELGRMERELEMLRSGWQPPTDTAG